MTIIHRQVTLGTAAVEIAGHDNMPHNVSVSNNASAGGEEGSTNFMFLGSSTVTSGNGLKLTPGQTVNLVVESGDRLFAVSSPSGIVVSVLDMRRGD
jgi:hypothetical protein